MTTALIVDDERLMRDMLRRRLNQVWPELEIVGEAENGEKALDQVEALNPDLVFLDIRMPGMTGLEVAAQLSHDKQRCHIVFITAYDQHAVEAFERGAIDYLLKPVEEDRLRVTVERIRERVAVAPAAPAPQLADLLTQLAERLPGAVADRLAAVLVQRNAAAAEETESASVLRPGERLRWVKASIGNSVRLIPIDEIIYFQADTKYTRVVTAQLEALIRTPLKELLEGLDAEKFWQIHRGTVVNSSEIIGATRDFRGHLLVNLKNRPEKLEVSRTYSDLFKHM